MIGRVKPPPFAYHAPDSLDEALSVLAEVGDHGKILAGGQSLVPILNMRLAAPEHLIDINRIEGLAHITPDAGGVRVGALARHADVEGDEAAHAVQPLLREALRLVAHPVIRNRGTTVGSLAHADPAAEMTAVLTLLQGSVDAASLRGTRTIAADEFFAGPLESTLQPDELALSAWFPRLVEHSGVTFEEVARRHGDYALCGVAAMVRLDADLRVAAAGAAYISMAPTPVRIDLSEAVAGASYDGADWAAAAAHAQGQLDPEPDIHASAEYRLHLAGILTRRALARAAGRAAEGAE